MSPTVKKITPFLVSGEKIFQRYSMVKEVFRPNFRFILDLLVLWLKHDTIEITRKYARILLKYTQDEAFYTYKVI